MAKMTKEEQNQLGVEWYERTHKNWRSWGSWFSWGSPVGLSIFLISLAVCAWILTKAF